MFLKYRIKRLKKKRFRLERKVKRLERRLAKAGRVNCCNNLVAAMIDVKCVECQIKDLQGEL